MNAKLIQLAIFPHASMAHIARSYLEASGMRCFIFNEHVDGLGWNYGTALSGIRLMIIEEDYEEGLRLLREYPEIDPSEISIEKGEGK